MRDSHACATTYNLKVFSFPLPFLDATDTQLQETVPQKQQN